MLSAWEAGLGSHNDDVVEVVSDALETNHDVVDDPATNQTGAALLLRCTTNHSKSRVGVQNTMRGGGVLVDVDFVE